MLEIVLPSNSMPKSIRSTESQHIAADSKAGGDLVAGGAVLCRKALIFEQTVTKDTEQSRKLNSY